MATKSDKDREDRIIMEIVVDAYGPEERAMGWHCYLESTLKFPFAARCAGKRVISSLKIGEAVKVTEMAPAEECEHEMFVMTEDEEGDELAVPLSQLKVGKKVDVKTRQAVEDWAYWVKMGYRF